MVPTSHDDDTRERVQRDPEVAQLWRESAVDLLEGNAGDRRSSLKIPRDHFGLTDAETQALRVAQETSPRASAYFVSLGEYKLDAYDYAEAIANYDRAITLDPDSVAASHDRALVQAHLEGRAIAVADYDTDADAESGVLEHNEATV